MIRVTVDVSADLKRLRRLEQAGNLKIHAVSIENHTNTKRIKDKEPPLAVIGSKFATIGNSVIGSSANSYSKLQQIIGKAHHADILHIERHLESGRDCFVTDDQDFLSKRDELASELNLRIVTVQEMEQLVDG